MTTKLINIHIGYAANDYLACTTSHREYANKNGYDYVQVTEAPIGENPVWFRHRFCRDIIGDVDQIMMIDSDTEILAQCPPFHEVVESNSGYDLFLAFGHSFRPNAGVIFFRGGRSSISGCFMDRLLAERFDPLPDQDRAVDGGDNGRVINLLRRDEFKSRYFPLSTVWNNTFQPTDWDYIRHYTGPMRGYYPFSDKPGST